MGILKSIDEKIRKAEKKYGKIKKETAHIRGLGQKAFDFVIPPPKKKGAKAAASRVPTQKTIKTKIKSKKGSYTCTCKRQ